MRKPVSPTGGWFETADSGAGHWAEAPAPATTAGPVTGRTRRRCRQCARPQSVGQTADQARRPTARDRPQSMRQTDSVTCLSPTCLPPVSQRWPRPQSMSQTLRARPQGLGRALPLHTKTPYIQRAATDKEKRNVLRLHAARLVPPTYKEKRLGQNLAASGVLRRGSAATAVRF